MQGLLSAIGVLFGKLMYFIYNTVGLHNYALSLVLFTLVYKIILLPLSIKQMKASQKMQEIQPDLQRIQARYKNDKEKLQEETLKLYQEKGYNPSSGCLPLLIQLPIILALFYVIRMPMSYMLEIPAKAIGEMTVVSVESNYLSYDKVGKETYDEIKDNPIEVYKKFTQRDSYFEIKVLDTIRNHPELIEENKTLSEDNKDVLRDFDLRVFKIFNLGVPPTVDPKTIIQEPGTHLPSLVLVGLAVLTTFATTKMMMPAPPAPEGKDKKGANNAGCAGNSMLWVSPLMTLWICLSTPSGLSMYWIINNIFSYVQQKFMKVFMDKDKKEGKEDVGVVKVDSERSKKR